MALDEAALKQVNDAITAALAAAMKPEALGAALAPAVKAHVEAATKGLVTEDSLKTALAEVVKAAKPADGEGSGAGKGKEGKGAEDNAAVAALQKQLDDQRAKLDAAERARIDAERKGVIDANRAKVRDALVKAGADQSALHLIVPALEQSGTLILDGDKPGWKGKDAYSLDTVLDFEAGAKAWTATPDGKRFLPASGAQGTGEGNHNTGGRGNGAGQIKSLDEVRGSLAGALFGN